MIYGYLHFVDERFQQDSENLKYLLCFQGKDHLGGRKLWLEQWYWRIRSNEGRGATSLGQIFGYEMHRSFASPNSDIECNN